MVALNGQTHAHLAAFLAKPSRPVGGFILLKGSLLIFAGNHSPESSHVSLLEAAAAE